MLLIVTVTDVKVLKAESKVIVALDEKLPDPIFIIRPLPKVTDCSPAYEVGVIGSPLSSTYFLFTMLLL